MDFHRRLRDGCLIFLNTDRADEPGHLPAVVTLFQIGPTWSKCDPLMPLARIHQRAGNPQDAALAGFPSPAVEVCRRPPTLHQNHSCPLAGIPQLRWDQVPLLKVSHKFLSISLLGPEKDGPRGTLDDPYGLNRACECLAAGYRSPDLTAIGFVLRSP